MDLSEYANIKKYEDTHWWYVSTHRAVLRELCLAPQSKVLDAGCGTGGLLNLLGEQFQVTGFDASLDAVRAASERKNLSHRVTQGFIEAIPFENEQFDAVTCIDVIYHQKVLSEHAALLEIRRVLKPGGRLILQVPAFEFLRGGHDEAVHTRKRYRADEVRSLLNESGFRVVKIFYRFPWLFLPALFIRKSTKGSGKTDLRPVNPVLNSLLTHISDVSDSPIFHRLPFGTSIFAVGEKIS